MPFHLEIQACVQTCGNRMNLPVGLTARNRSRFSKMAMILMRYENSGLLSPCN